jgi:hypothetical protein
MRLAQFMLMRLEKSPPRTLFITPIAGKSVSIAAGRSS